MRRQQLPVGKSAFPLKSFFAWIEMDYEVELLHFRIRPSTRRSADSPPLRPTHPCLHPIPETIGQFWSLVSLRRVFENLFRTSIPLKRRDHEAFKMISTQPTKMHTPIMPSNEGQWPDEDAGRRNRAKGTDTHRQSNNGSSTPPTRGSSVSGQYQAQAQTKQNKNKTCSRGRDGRRTSIFF